ncbi:hypothetical protein R1sor_009383 [Riccia sorocarpa]|uniref:Phytol kinase n=1 Tax=Riccia sorocarpa TaxID=122646 RepID=A0ABD3HYH6_9MARC
MSSLSYSRRLPSLRSSDSHGALPTLVRAPPSFLISGLKSANWSSGGRGPPGVISSISEIHQRYSLAGGCGVSTERRFHHPGEIVGFRIAERWRRASRRESVTSAAAMPKSDDETDKMGGETGIPKSTMFLSGISFTPGMALAFPHASLGMGMSMHDIVACGITIAVALSLLKFFDELAKREVLEKKLSRKLVHISVGLVYLLFWPLFSNASYTKYLCALAPGGNTVRMLALGFGLLENEAMVRAMSREGDRRELLKGPFYYGLAIVITTVCFWRTSPVGIVALVNLCAGDGIADIIGRNFGGKSRLPWNEDKSWAGSVAFFLASTGASILYLLYFAHFGYLKMQPGIYIGVALVSFLTAIVESLPISTRLDDNLTVPLAAIVLGYFILPA